MSAPTPAIRNPTAKEIAQEALDGVGELRAQFGTILTELRENGQGGPFPPSGLDEKLQALDKEFGEFVEAVNKRFAADGGGQVVALDAAPIQKALQELEEKTSKSFAAYSKIVDGYNTAATQAIEELREQMPSVADLVSKVGQLEEWQATELEDPVITPDARAELNDVHQRINELREDLSATRQHVGELTIPLIAGAPRATAGAPAIYGQVHELMKLVTDLGKDKKADAKMGGYAFRSIDSAMDAVGRALREVGVMFQPREILDRRIERYETVSKDGYRQHWTHVWVTQRYAFVSLRDGSEMAAIEMDGEARDNGDKSTSKADSMRLKYALLQALMIPINGLPESDGRDGTEGDFGTPVGRGSAGDAFDNASSERPTAEEPTSTPYGYGHQPAASPGGQAHAQAQQEPRADDRTPEEKATAAYGALVALAGLEKPAQRPQLERILKGIRAEGIGQIVIQKLDGTQCTLDDYARAVNAQVGA